MVILFQDHVLMVYSSVYPLPLLVTSCETSWCHIVNFVSTNRCKVKSHLDVIKRIFEQEMQRLTRKCINSNWLVNSNTSQHWGNEENPMKSVGLYRASICPAPARFLTFNQLFEKYNSSPKQCHIKSIISD